MKNFIKTNNLDLDISGMVTQDLSPFTYKVSLQLFGVVYLKWFSLRLNCPRSKKDFSQQRKSDQCNVFLCYSLTPQSNIYFYSVSHTVSVADSAPVKFVHDTLVHLLLARVQLGVEETVRVGAGLALVGQVRGQHEEEVVGQDLRAGPGVLQESLRRRNILREREVRYD